MYAVKAGLLIDGTGAAPIHDALMLVNDERVEAVGRAADLGIPDGVEVIDYSGMTVMPGVIDAHTHILYTGKPRANAMSRYGESIAYLSVLATANAKLSLECGVTAIRDVGSTGYIDVALRDAIAEGLVPGPRMKVAGQGVTVTGGHMDPRGLPDYVQIAGRTGVANGPDQMRAAARHQLKMGADLIKINSDGRPGGTTKVYPLTRQEMTFEEMAAVCQVAHWEGKFVATHCAGGSGTMDAIRAGVNTLEHAHWLTDEHIEAMVEMGTFWVPTFTAPYNTLSRGREAADVMDTTWEWKTLAWEGAQESFARARKAGVPIAVGTDAGYRYCYHGETAREMLIMQEIGMTALEAIAAATSVAARAMDWADEIGSLTAGKYADFLVLNGDPLTDLSILLRPEDILRVVKGGQVAVSRESSMPVMA
ncbi:amidohydrolase family protein [bacterium]|nr:amidohydrolase family protein [bacterium]